MKMNNGGCSSCHNVQIAVDSKAHIVIAVDVTSEAGDLSLIHIWWTVLFVLLCGTALAMFIWKRKQENSTEEFDEEKTEDFAE